MPRQRYWLVVLLLIAFPVLSVVAQDIISTAYDESESASYDITPQFVLNSPRLRFAQPGILAGLLSARALFGYSMCGHHKCPFSIFDLFRGKVACPRVPLRC